MEFERHVFATPAELRVQARDSLDEGLFRRVGREDDEPALLWLDRLAARRSDWHEAIGSTLTSLAQDGGDAASAVVDWFDRAVTAPAFVQVLTRLRKEHPHLASTSPQTLDPQADPLPLTSVAPRIEQAASRYAQTTQHLLVRTPRREIMAVTGRADLLREAMVAAEQGESRLQGGIDGWYTLDFLRNLAFFVPWVRRDLPVVLTDLAGQGEAGARAAVEYAVRAGDAAWLLPTLRAWAKAEPVWTQAPADFPVAPAATLGECVQVAIQTAETEAATTPG